jgi:hypothetical protein
MGPKAGKEKRKKKKKKIILLLNPDCPHRREVVPGNPLAAERVV